LSNKPYKPDPGADAIILSDFGIASLEYQGDFYVQFERDVRIRIVNSNGYSYADIEIPYSIDDDLVAYKASTFNIRDGVKTETVIQKKSFIIEHTSNSTYTLKFNFPDVHEGSVIEYSYKMRMKNYSYMDLVPWEFQSDIPVKRSSITVSYADGFVYKSLISGSSMDVHTMFSKTNTILFGENVTASINTWYAEDVPAFREEPYILGRKESLTRLTFELARVDFPGVTLANISPTYFNLSKKILDWDDFGTPLNTNFKTLAEQITSGESDELSKLKKIHKYVSSLILWNGIEGFTTSFPLRTVMRKEKGNSADVNMMLIAMLRSIGIKADPVILSTRTNGSLNQNSAMLQQFNYVVAAVETGGKLYMVDATDPLRPYDLLPFDCLNNTGRLINISESRFVELKNKESFQDFYNINIRLDKNGNLSGDFKQASSGYSAYKIRKLIKLESEEGYNDILRTLSPYAEMSDFTINGIEDPYSDITVACAFKINSGAQIAGDEIFINPFILQSATENPFFSAERKFPVDFGCPVTKSFSMKLEIPEGYSLIDKPEDLTLNLVGGGAKFEFICKQDANILELESSFNIDKTIYPPSDYTSIRKFYLKVQKKQAESIVLKRMR
jgi:hypothetical protein